MALIRCDECGRDVSDRAAACPNCGAPIAASASLAPNPLTKNRGCGTFIVFLVVVFSIMYACSRTSDPGDGVFPASSGAASLPREVPTPAPASGAIREAEAPSAVPVDLPHEPSWKLVGQQGDMRFVVVDDPSGSKAEYHQAVTELCASRMHCFVNFWVDESVAPQRLPLNDAQGRGQVAGYRMNQNNGLSKWAWRCDLFPKTQPSECM